MKTLKIFVSVFAVMALMAACSSEEVPEPLYHSPAGFFRPADDDNSPTAELRREFFENYGSYLLFNDTIQKVFTGYDINGEPTYFIEKLDVAYNVGGSSSVSSDNSTYTYITDYDKQKQMVEFMEEYVLYHFQGKVKPFSYFVCDKIFRELTLGSSTPYVLSGQRTVVISGNYLLLRDRTDKQKKSYAERILISMLGALAINFNEDFIEFMDFSADYYAAKWENFSTDEKTGLCMMGFLALGEGLGTPTPIEDLSQYASATLQNTEEEFAKKYAAYPLMIQKFRFVKETFESLGFVYERETE